MAAAAPTFSTLFSTPAAYEHPNVDYAALTTAFGHAVPTAAQDIRHTCVHASVRTPIALAVISQDDPQAITIVHSVQVFPPALGAAAHPADGMAIGFHGNHLDTLIPIFLPTNAFGRPNAATRTLSPEDTVALLVGGAVFAPIVAAANAAGVDTRVRRVLVLPTEWGPRAIAHGSFSPAEFHAEFLAPIAGTPAQVAIYQMAFDWWKVAATYIDDGNGNNTSAILLTGTPAMSLPQKQSLNKWMTTGAQRLLQAIPTASDPLTAAAFAAAMGNVTNQIATHSTDMAAREAARAIPQTFSKRYGEAVRDEMMNILGVTSEANFPPTLVTLATHKKVADDLPTLRLVVDDRANAADCRACEFTRPIVTNHLLTMFRDYRLVVRGEELTSGFSVFPILCANTTEGKSAHEQSNIRNLIEQGSSAMNYQDATQFLVTKKCFPRDEHEGCDKLRGFSLVVDLMLGVNHATAVAFRSMMMKLEVFLTSGLRSQYRESPGKRLALTLRIMLFITYEFQTWVSNRRMGGAAATPTLEWKELEACCQGRSWERLLPDLPESWLEAVRVQDPTPAPAPSPAPAPAPTEAAASQRVTNHGPNKALQRRFKASEFNNVGPMVKRAKEAQPGIAMPTLGGSEACITWMLMGKCWENCKYKSTHVRCTPACAAKVHELMTAADIPALDPAQQD